MKRMVWIISEGSPGHTSQSEGLVAALARQVDLEYVIIQTRPRLNGFGRDLVRWWMGRSGRPLSSGFLKNILGCDLREGTPPDLIVTSGGRAVFAARTLAARLKVPLVFVGERKPYPSEWFHTALTPSPFETGVNDIWLDLIPTQITCESLEKAAASWSERPTGRLWTMIVGGISASHCYTSRDWSALAQCMNAVARKEGIRWLITTSRRTGSATEELLREMLDPATLADAIWWSSRPEKRLHALLGAAERIFVTQDSITMITEAIASRVPVEVLYPGTTTFATTSFIPSYLQRLEASGRIHRHLFDSLTNANFQPWQPDSSPPETDLAVKLLVRLAEV